MRRKKRIPLYRKIKFAQKLRRNPTPAEKRMKDLLDEYDWGSYVKWIFQPIVMGFIPDFLESRNKLILEIDGGIHQLRRIRIKDKEKTRIFQTGGYRVLRLRNEDVLRFPQRCLQRVVTTLVSHSKSERYTGR